MTQGSLWQRVLEEGRKKWSCGISTEQGGQVASDRVAGRKEGMHREQCMRITVGCLSSSETVFIVRFFLTKAKRTQFQTKQTNKPTSLAGGQTPIILALKREQGNHEFKASL